jgi:glycosyltransferase involved in cell wall biosynthesis
MRLLYLTERLTDHDRRIVRRILEASHQVAAASLDPSDAGNPVAPGVLTAALGTRRRLADLRALVQDVDPDLVQAGPLTSTAYLAARCGVAPLAVTSWAYDLLRLAARRREDRRRVQTALGAAALLVTDAAVTSAAARSLGYRNPILQVPWGVDLERFHPADPALGVGHTPTVLSARAWEPMYRVDTVVAAVALARREDPRLRLELLNDGRLRPSILAAIERAGIAEAVNTPGRLTEASFADRLRGAAVYVSASEVDGSSVSLLQALASGVPVVASDVEGNREWLDGRVGARLCPVGDARAFSAAILEAVALPARRRAAVANRARRLAERRADWRVNGARLVHAYERVMRVSP